MRRLLKLLTLNGIVMCSLMLTLGCSAKQESIQTPPEVWLQEIPVPKMKGPTNNDLLQFALETEKVALQLNNNVKSLRDWYGLSSK